MTTSAIILNYNGKEVIGECIESLLKQSTMPDEVIVVDNGSIDNSIEIVKQFPQVKLIELKENVGVGAGYNAGIKASKGENLLLLNNDVTLDKYCVENLVEYRKLGHNIGMVQPKIMYADTPSVINSLGLWINREGFAGNISDGKIDGLFENKFIFGCGGGAFMYTREALKSAGLFDASYQFYFEDVDISWRIQQCGFSCLLVPSALVYHKCGYSTKKLSNYTRDYYSHRNRITTLAKRLEKDQFVAYLPWLVLSELKIIGLSLVSRRWGMLKGNIAGLLNARNARRNREVLTCRTVDWRIIDKWFKGE